MTMDRTIIDAAARMRRNRDPHLIATLVRAHGANCQPGARMLLSQFRWTTGAVSGDWLAGDLASTAWRRTRDGAPVLITCEARAHDEVCDDDLRAAFGLATGGSIDVMLERADLPGQIDPLAFAEQCLRTQRRGAIATVIRSEAPGISPGLRLAVLDGDEAIGPSFDVALRAGMLADAQAVIATGESSNRRYRSELGSVDVFVEALLPPPRVFVFGTGHDAVPLVGLVRTVGWEAVVCCAEVREATRRRFTAADEIIGGPPAELAERVNDCECAIAIVMAHHDETDRANLAMLLDTHCNFIGIVGARARAARMIAELGVGSDADGRVHAPVGLALGARTAAETAVAIVAEIQTSLAQAPDSVRREDTSRVTGRRLPRITEAVAAAAPIAS